MSRIDPVDVASVSPAVQALLRAIPDLGLFRTMAHAESLFPAWLELGSRILNELTLEPVTRQLVVVQVARLMQCEAMGGQHEALALAVGVTAEQLAALGTDASCFTERERRALEFASEIVAFHRPSDETFEAARSVFGERELVELVCVIGHYSGVARLLLTFDVPPEPAVGGSAIGALGATVEKPASEA